MIAPFVEREKLPAGDVEIEAVQSEEFCRLAVANDREGAQICQRLADRGQFEGRFLTIFENFVFLDVETVKQRQPGADKGGVVGLALQSLPVSLDAAAMRMTKHDDMRHFEHERRVFDRRAGAVIFPGGS